MRKINLNSFQVATNETVGDINRRIMLNLVRKHQPVSRADLTRFSGLQRSTVSAITERLISEGWLKEGAMGHLPRGRRPTFLHLNSERSGIIGVDVQPAVTTVAVTDLGANFLAQESIPTAKDPGEFVSRLSRRVTDLMRAHPKNSYEGVGISLPGRMDVSDRRRLVFAPMLGWNGVDLKTPLEAAIKMRVELENAANACALAELWSGHEGTGNLVAVTISDDISVGMIMNGQLIRGSSGMVGEFGHVRQMPEGPKCRCGNAGCWEALASNSAAVRYYEESASLRKGEVGSKSDMAKLSFADILRSAARGDARSGKALDHMARHLGDGIAMLVTGLAPDVLVIVGDVTRAWDRVGPIVAEALKRRPFMHATTRIVPTDPEAQPRLRGTIALVLQNHFGAPSIA